MHTNYGWCWKTCFKSHRGISCKLKPSSNCLCKFDILHKFGWNAEIQFTNKPFCWNFQHSMSELIKLKKKKQIFCSKYCDEPQMTHLSDWAKGVKRCTSLSLSGSVSPMKIYKHSKLVNNFLLLAASFWLVQHLWTNFWFVQFWRVWNDLSLQFDLLFILDHFDNAIYWLNNYWIPENCVRAFNKFD